ncbi:MAG TPA: IS630 family transposase [Ktedonobacteraceae bacterium]|nr:IS630 family transposase [Ktedonobacteraceae bacterium]
MTKRSITLSEGQHRALESLTKKGVAPANLIRHAQILSHIDRGPKGPGWSTAQIIEAFTVRRSTVERVRKRFLEQGLDAALVRRPQPARPHKRKLDGQAEAHLVALLCGQKPEEAERWSLRLVREKLVELEIVSSISHETVRQGVKKNELKPWLKQCWCIPPEANGSFVYHMEEVLAVYTRPSDARRPLICMDEGATTLQAHKHDPLGMQAGKSEREEYEYERAGYAQVFLAVEPLAGKRIVQARARRTKADWAYFMRELIEVHYRQAEKLVVVMDNLNPHSPASLYEVFPPEEAWRLSQKLEIHHTPVHGSWLNRAEMELSVLARQALSGRIPSLDVLQERVTVWYEHRNQHQTTIDWRFTTADARIKLKRLYPSLEA